MDYQGEIAPVNLAFDSLSYIRGQCNSLLFDKLQILISGRING